MKFNAGDLIVRCRNHYKDIWVVNGIFLGAENQESVVELERLGLSVPNAYGCNVPMYIPIVLLEDSIQVGICRHYTRVKQ